MCFLLPVVALSAAGWLAEAGERFEVEFEYLSWVI